MRRLVLANRFGALALRSLVAGPCACPTHAEEIRPSGSRAALRPRTADSPAAHRIRPSPHIGERAAIVAEIFVDGIFILARALILTVATADAGGRYAPSASVASGELFVL